MLLVAALAALAACPGKPVGTTPEPPRKPTNGPTCEAVGDAMVNQLLADKDPRPPDDTVDPIRNLITKRCTADNWTLAAKQCLLTMKDGKDAEHCATMLTDEQQEALMRDQNVTFGERKPPPGGAPVDAGAPAD
jgi:hypothetical protein